MTAGSRFKSWIEIAASDWAPRLGGWMMGWVSGGVDTFTKDREPELIKINRRHLEKLRETPGLPQEIKDLIDESLKTGDIGTVVLGYILNAFGALLGLFSVGAPMGRVWSYLADRHAQSARFDPALAIAMWRRDPNIYKQWQDDILDQGWSQEQIEAWKFVTQAMPSPRDIVGFLAHEVFEPDMISKYGLLDEWEGIDKTYPAKVGLKEDELKLYWLDHWQHASWQQVVEMLHRGQLTEAQVWDWFRLVEIPPFWRDKLIATSWNVPTRVDVRRFYDLRTIDEARLREIYTAMGYHGSDLDDYVLWTKIYVEFPDLLARFKNGWISLEEVRSRLIVLGMDETAAEELIQTKIQSESAARTNADKDLTLTDIYKGVKQERITRAEAVGLIMDLGYSEDEAGFKLDVNVPSDEQVSAVEQRQLAKSDIAAGYKNGIITREGARQMLLALNYTAVDVEFLLKLYDAAMKPPEEEKTRALAKADIVTGVKKGIITQDEGLGMLIDIGYSEADASFILTINAEESPFSPVNFEEFKERTQKWRLAAGLGRKPMTEEIKKLGAEVVRISAEVSALEKSIREEQGKLVPDTVLPEEAIARVKELQATLYKAQAEMARVKTDYNAKIAEWKHAG